MPILVRCFKVLVLALVSGLVGCAPTHYLVTKRCPVPTSAVLLDVLSGVGAFGISALKENAGKTNESIAYSALGVSLIGSAYVSELMCSKKP